MKAARSDPGSGRATLRFLVRARGPLVFNLRVWAAGLGVPAVLFGWRGAGSAGALIGMFLVLLLQALLFRPRIVVTEREVTVYFLWRCVRAERATLASVELAAERMWGARAHHLVLVVGDQVVPFRWVAWSDWSEWWLERSVPTPRQTRVLEKFRSVIDAERGEGRAGTGG